MKVIWAPWRIDFIETQQKSCIFCDAIKANKKSDKENLVLYRGKNSFIIMNKYPYNNGHLMFVPIRHISKISELTKEELTEIFSMVNQSEKCLKEKFKPNGFNFGANIGEDAGAGFEHLHFHLVPRWRGDTNFMPVIGEIKVLPEHLYRTYDKLKGCF
ncbi:MAG: HIT domain-containing protein [Conexivisphaerales archaeon]